MEISDEFSKNYETCLDGSYDCVDRIVLNAYFGMAQTGGGFRFWWRMLTGGDEKLDNTRLMRFPGRFSRRIHAYAKKEAIPLFHCQPGERKHEIAGRCIPKYPAFQGLFCILVSRAPASIIEVKRFEKGGLDIRKKTPQPYVNHYFFHIMDSEWGHLTIRLCPHPPFNAQIILNGHEYVAIRAKKNNISFNKEDNCFTEVNNAAGLAGVADTMRAPCSVGRLVQVCERWIYSTCLLFALDLEEQRRSGFRYSYSVYQAEYSRNLLFTRGRTLDEVFNGVIDRTRSMLDIKMVKTIFGYKHRPFYRRNGKGPRFEAVVEKPVYNLTVFKLHFGKLTVKMYSKGEHVLRIEVIAHNTKDLRCKRGVDNFPAIMELLKDILEKFLGVMSCVDVSFIDNGTLEAWPLPSMIGAGRVAGLDVNRSRTRAAMKAVIVLAAKPRGFTSADMAEKVKEKMKELNAPYHSRQASYDLKKFRGKKLVRRIPGSRRYEATGEGLKAITSFIVLYEKVLTPLLATRGKREIAQKSPNRGKIDIHYENIQVEMQKLFNLIGIAA